MKKLILLLLIAIFSSSFIHAGQFIAGTTIFDDDQLTIHFKDGKTYTTHMDYMWKQLQAWEGYEYRYTDVNENENDTYDVILDSSMFSTGTKNEMDDQFKKATKEIQEMGHTASFQRYDGWFWSGFNIQLKHDEIESITD